MAQTETEFTNRSHNVAKGLVALGTGAAIVGTAALAVGQATQRNVASDIQEQNTHNTEVIEAAHHAKIIEAMQKDYGRESVIDQPFKIPEGGNLEGTALAVLEQHLGKDVYDDTLSLIYPDLHESAASYDIVKANEEFVLVETRLDDKKDSPDSYIITTPDHYIQVDATKLPTPQTH